MNKPTGAALEANQQPLSLHSHLLRLPASHQTSSLKPVSTPHLSAGLCRAGELRTTRQAVINTQPQASNDEVPAEEKTHTAELPEPNHTSQVAAA